jgi:hypothetical protein
MEPFFVPDIFYSFVIEFRDHVCGAIAAHVVNQDDLEVLERLIQN